MKNFIRLILIAVLTPPRAVFATALGSLAADMKSGQWAVLNSNGDSSGFSQAMLQVNTQEILQWMDKGTWDSRTKRVLFIGQGHYEIQKFIGYDDAANAWNIEPKPYWDCSAGAPSGSCIGHGNEHNAINVAGREFYYRQYNTDGIFSYNIDGKSWTQLPSPVSALGGVNGNSLNVAAAVEYFPEMGGLLYVDAAWGIAFYNRAAGVWSRLANTDAAAYNDPSVPTYPLSGYLDFASYNPVHKTVWFGGGGILIYKLDAAGKITALKNAPAALGIYDSIVTVDPAGGDYLVLTNDGRFFAYDIVNDAWKTLDASGVPVFGGGDSTTGAMNIFGKIAIPIATYGVVMFVKYDYGNSAVYLYKHSSGGPPLPVDVLAPAKPTGLVLK